MPATAPAVSDTLYEIELQDGESYVGRIVASAGDTLTLRTAAGATIRFPTSRIASVHPARGRVVHGEFWREDPNATRLFFSPTGRSLARGEGYVGVLEVFVPYVGLGFSDRVMISGGSPFYLVPWTDGLVPVYFQPQLQVVARQDLAAAVGTVAMYLPDDGGDDEIFGVAYGVASYGTPDNSVTGGLGWGYVRSDFSPTPVVMIGGQTRVSRSIKLMTENLFVPGEEGVIVSGGLRFLGERLSADAGLAALTGEDGGCCFPMVNINYRFGPQR
ncbi:MAG TPA: hypothetical protein VFI96_08560 [Longimicrobiaceae bacterium]|nr:hypothetical protein [Longimicrobiaceae bacterium]